MKHNPLTDQVIKPENIFILGGSAGDGGWMGGIKGCQT